MITTLSRLSLCDFIELLCGNNGVLVEDGDSDACVSKVASELIYQYQCIVNPSGVESSLIDKEEVIKVRYRIAIVKILKALMSINAVDDVSELLSSMNINVSGTDNISKKLDRMLAEAEYMKKRIDDRREEKHAHSADDIRRSYDSEIAFLMTYYKMNIDSRNITAGVYANMVHRADVEIKRRINR